MIILLGLIIGTGVLYLAEVIRGEALRFGNGTPLILLLIIVIFMIFFIKHRSRDINADLPMEDERSKKVMTQAAAMGFYVTMYWLLAISFFESFFARMFGVVKLDAGQVVGGGIAGMSIIFIIAWFYYQSKGRLL